MFKDAIILAGGFGTRLRSVVSDRPKPLAQIRQLPFLWYVLRRLYRYGVPNIYLSVGYMSDSIKKFIEDYQIKYWFDHIQIIEEESPLGTGGALLNALHTIKIDRSLLLLNGDTFLDINFYNLWQHHIRYHANVTLSLFQADNSDKRYGPVYLDANDRVYFTEQNPSYITYDHSWINAGIYAIDPQFLKRLPLPAVPFHFDQDFLHPLHDYLRIFGYQCDGSFIDIGLPSDYHLAQTMNLPH